MNLDNILTAADSTAVEAGEGQGFFAAASDVVTKGIPSAAVSGLVSLANTGIFYKNKLFGGDTEELDVAELLDRNSATMGDYYRENKQAIDVVGFVGASFIPGSIAVAGVRAAQASRIAGSFRYAGFVPARAQEAALREGMKQIATKGPSVFGSINSTKMAALSWGFADNVLQAAAFETAAAVALYRSPTLKDESLGDIAWDIAKGTVLGGAIGGAVEGLMVNKIFKNTAKAVEGRLRQVDTITAMERMGLAAGDEAFATIESVLEIGKKLVDDPLTMNFRLNGRDLTESLDTAELVKKTAKLTEEKALERVQAKITSIFAGDPTVGRVLAADLIDQVKKGIAEGVDEEVIKHQFGDMMWGLKKAEGLGSDDVKLGKEVFYLQSGSHLGNREGMAAAITTTRPGGKAQAYIMDGAWEDARLGTLGIDGAPGSLADAWKLGFDAVIDPKTKRFEINPGSSIFRAVNPKSQDEVVSRIYNPRTKTTMDDAVAYVADLATQNSPLQVKETAVISGKRVFVMDLSWKGSDDPLEVTARHLWASEKVNSLKKTTVSWDDFALLNRIVERPDVADATTMLKMADGNTIPVTELTDFSGWVIEQKVRKAAELGKRDIRETAAILGTEPQWVEKMTSVGGSVTELKADRAISFRPQASFKERENIILSYDKAAMETGQDFIDGVRAYQTRVTEAQRRMDEAALSVLDEDQLAGLPEVPGISAKMAESSGAGPSALGFANADYTDPLRNWAQASGSWLQNAAQLATAKALDPMQPAAARILASKNLELGAITSWYRSLDDAVALDGNRIVDLAYLKAKQAAELAGKSTENLKPKIVRELSDDVAEFLGAFNQRHRQRNSKQDVLRTAAGFNARFDPDQLYLPPIDTRKVPYFALVREADGRAFNGGGVSMITARDPKQLQELVAKVKADHPHLDVLLKGDTEAFHKAKGDYEFQSGMNSLEIDSALRKSGALRDFTPVLDPAAVIDEYVNFTTRSEQQLLRNVVAAKNAQLFRELEWLSEQNTKFAESKFGYIGKLTGKTLEDPFGDYKRLALNISKKAEYPIWHQLNEFVDSLGERGYKIAERMRNKAANGEITWQEANAAMERVGISGPFTDQAGFFDAQLKGSGNIFRSAVAKANTLLATVGLRLDAANAAVNILSAPLMQAAEISAIRNSIKRDPELLARFNQMMQVSSPDGSVTVPTVGKLWAGAMGSFFGGNKAELLKRYENIGVVKGDIHQFHAMLEDLALLPTLKDASKFSKLVDTATEKGAKFTGNNFAEQFTRFVSADMMRQLTQPVVEAGKMSVKEQDTYIRIFVNRTQGNYVASQRPIAFQGTVGAAVSLFQTYAFNLYQQLFRHIENRDLRTVAVMGGMQSGLFGLNGMPMFDAINTHLIGTASINEGHRDAYSTAVGFAGKELGDWAMYGSLSAMPFLGDKVPALYTRGDLNPRHLTILPTSFADVPAVSVGTRMLQAVKNFGSQVSAGNDMGDAFLHALEHNGLSRPLAGLAQIIQGESTTSKGALISAHADLGSVASAARILGAKPMDEAVALQTRFRLEAYKAHDRDRIEKLGVAVKQKLRSGEVTEDDFLDFAAEYASRGGRVESYNAAMKRWMKDANQSTVNTLMNSHKTVYGQRLMEIMGGDPLPDYAGAGPEE